MRNSSPQPGRNCVSNADGFPDESMTIPLTDLYPEGNPFLEQLGVKIRAYGDGQATLELVLQAGHMNGWHALHGGLTLTLLDVSLALAGRSLDPEAVAIATIDMSCSFVQPGGTAGDTVCAKANAYHRAKSLCFSASEIWNGSRLVARGMGTFKTIRK